VSASAVTLVAAGICTITATQTGDANFLDATPVPQSFTVNRESQTINFSGTLTLPAGPITLNASATSGLPVALISMTPSICAVSGTTATAQTSGTCTIQATQTGNGDYLAAKAVSQSFVIPAFSKCDINQDGSTNSTDVLLMLKQSLGISAPNNDLNGNGTVNVVDIETVVNAALQSSCEAQ
jgi:hypothetical protein